MTSARRSGILLHPTSLPGRYGIGDLGSEAYRFVDFLLDTGQRLWQVLPLGPTGYGDSPYQCFSAFAGNPLLISLEKLVEEGALSPADVEDVPSFPAHEVDYGWVIHWKIPLLRKAAADFRERAEPSARDEFHAFCQEQAPWLEDYALFMALKDAHGGATWTTWEPDIARRQPEAVRRWREQQSAAIHAHKYVQFQFFRQWWALKTHCNAHGIQIIGDIPIFVAHDSADVWAHPEMFHLDEDGSPTVVAGVPPDYFSATGQLWGNPLYRWDVLAQSGYAWWIERFRTTLTTVDIVRLDHFRGFESYWEVPGGETTAINGRWVPGPGAALFEALRQALGHLPIIAEDLGVITPEVEALRDQFGLPGMRILQFAFGTDPKARDFRPFSYPRHCVVYTGTHDNDTVVGWFTSEGSGNTTRSAEDIAAERALVLKYLGTDGHEIHWDMIRLALSSVANTAIIPLQDVLGLGSEARMNIPSRPSGNWKWRFTPDVLTDDVRQRLWEMTDVYGR